MERADWDEIAPWLDGLTFPCSTDQVVQWLKVHRAPERVVRSIESLPTLSLGGPHGLQEAYEEGPDITDR